MNKKPSEIWENPPMPENKPTKECKQVKQCKHLKTNGDICIACGTNIKEIENMQRWLGAGTLEKGGYEYNKQELENKTLNSVLKEADKLFDEFIKKWCPSWKHLIDNDENDGERFRNILHSQIKKSFKAGQEDGSIINGIEIDFIDLKQQTLKQIGEWCEKYMDKTTKYYGTDKHGIDLEDLKKFINTL